MFKILVLNGPNLNLLGEREPEHYGKMTLEAINQQLNSIAGDHQILHFQSNSESELIERIHAARKESIDFMIINPAAFSHTSIALRDAILAVNIRFIEVHLTNVSAREPFRQHSYFSDIASGVISGLGPRVYSLALQAVLSILSNSR